MLTSGAAVAAAVVENPLKPPLSSCWSPVTCFGNLQDDNVMALQKDGPTYGGFGGGGGGVSVNIMCGSEVLWTFGAGGGLGFQKQGYVCVGWTRSRAVICRSCLALEVLPLSLQRQRCAAGGNCYCRYCPALAQSWLGCMLGAVIAGRFGLLCCIATGPATSLSAALAVAVERSCPATE